MMRTEYLISLRLLFFGVVLAWHAFWWFGLKTEPFMTFPREEGVSIRCLLSSENRASLWGPILFSLPSQSGFSGSLIKSREPSQPPLQYHESLAIFSSPQHSGSLDLSWEPRSLREEALDRVKQTDVFQGGGNRDPYLGRPQIVRNVLELAYEGGDSLGGIDLTLFFSEEHRPVESGGVLFDLDLDEQRWPESIRIVQSSGDAAWDAYLVQRLYQVRIPRSSDKIESHARLLFTWPEVSHAD